MSYSPNAEARSKWPTWVVLAVLLVATYFDWYWVWGVLYLYWGVAPLSTGEVFLVQTVRREENPGLFWSVSVMWVVLAVLVIMIDLFPGVSTWMEGGGG